MPENTVLPQTELEKLADNIKFQEWKQCQESLARFDKINIDTRKYGFSLITLLLGANGFLLANSELSNVTIIGIYLALLVLIAALFRIDRTHEIFLRATVIRAIKLEKELGLGLSIAISHWSTQLKPGTWGVWLYTLFCVAACVLTAGAIIGDLSSFKHNWPWVAAAFIILIVLSMHLWKYHKQTSRIQ